MCSQRDDPTDVDSICKFAQYEFKHGDPERGKTMFESLLGSYPKRVDLWSVYIDCVRKQGDLDKVRCVCMVRRKLDWLLMWHIGPPVHVYAN